MNRLKTCSASHFSSSAPNMGETAVCDGHDWNSCYWMPNTYSGTLTVTQPRDMGKLFYTRSYAAGLVVDVVAYVRTCMHIVAPLSVV